MSALGIGFALILRSGGQGAAFDLTGPVLPGGVVVTRASTGTRVSAGGVIVTEAANQPRFDHHPATGGPLGLLIEPARSNLLLSSGSIGSGWTVSSATVAINATGAPDGTMSGSVFTSSNATVLQRVLQSVLPGAGQWVASVYFRAAGLRFVQILFGAISTDYAVFDLVTGSVASGSYINATITDSGNGWWRCTLTATLAAGSGSVIVCGCDSGTAPRSATMTGDGVAGFHLWGAQLENGAGATSMIPTTGSAASRAGEAVTLPWGVRGVPDGVIDARVTFDDLSSQMMAMTVAGGVSTLTAPLNRGRVRRVERV